MNDLFEGRRRLGRKKRVVRLRDGVGSAESRTVILEPESNQGLKDDRIQKSREQIHRKMRGPRDISRVILPDQVESVNGSPHVVISSPVNELGERVTCFRRVTKPNASVRGPDAEAAIECGSRSSTKQPDRKVHQRRKWIPDKAACENDALNAERRTAIPGAQHLPKHLRSEGLSQQPARRDPLGCQSFEDRSGMIRK